MAMQLMSYAPQIQGPSSGTPMFGGVGPMTQITGPVGSRPSLPLNVFSGATFNEPAPMDADKGQLSCSWEFITVKGASSRDMAPGVGKEHLFFVHTPTDAPFQRRVTCTVKSLTDLNKLVFLDAWNARANPAHRVLYHAHDAHNANLFTASAIRRDWALMGICTATEGADERERALMDKVTITARVGGHAQCFNYWALRESGQRLYLILKLVRVLTDSNGVPIPGSYTDTSDAANWAQLRGADILDESDEVADYKRRRMENAAGAGRIGEPIMAWQFVPYVDRTGEGPPASEFTGSFLVPDVANPDQGIETRWVGAAIYVGRSLFVGAQGFSGMKSRTQIDAALAFTHTFDTSKGDTSISSQVALAAAIGTTEVALHM